MFLDWYPSTFSLFLELLKKMFKLSKNSNIWKIQNLKENQTIGNFNFREFQTNRNFRNKMCRGRDIVVHILLHACFCIEKHGGKGGGHHPSSVPYACIWFGRRTSECWVGGRGHEYRRRAILFPNSHKVILESRY